MQNNIRIFRFSGITSIIVLLFFVFACDHGIDPGEPKQVNTKTGFSGTIYYQNWPSADSLHNLKIVVFENYPPADIVGEVLSGSATAYPSALEEHLPYNQNSTAYEMLIDSGRYEYIVIAQQFGQGIYFDWWVVGQYDTTQQDTIPTGITVLQDSILENINIYVDFDSVLFKP